MLYPGKEELDTITLYDETTGAPTYEYRLEETGSGTRFVQFVNLDSQEHNTIFVPVIRANYDLPLNNQEALFINTNTQVAERYIAGQIILSSDLFSNMDNITIASSQHVPTIIEEGCLATGHHYNFILPNNMDILEVSKINRRHPNVFPRKYLMLADKRIKLNYVDEMGYSTVVKKYAPKRNVKGPIITLDKNYVCENGIISKVEKEENIEM